MMANIKMANMTSSPICMRGAKALRMDLRTTCKPEERKKVKVLVRKLFKFESFVMMSHDAAWPCTAQRRASGTVPCHHPFKTKQI